MTDVEAAQDPIASAARGDYAYRMAHIYGGDAEEAWNAHGAPVAALVNELLSTAKDVGVPFIARRARLDDLTAAAEASANVILMIAHWRGYGVSGADLRPGIVCHLRGGAMWDLLEAQFEADLLTESEASMNLLAQSLDKFVQAVPGQERARREWLENMAPEHLVPGGCLELSDGYAKPETCAAALPCSWSGLIDLGVCHSVELAVAIKQNRGDRRCITNEEAKHPDRCLPEMHEALLRLSAESQVYADLKRSIFCTYSKLLKGLGV